MVDLAARLAGLKALRDREALAGNIRALDALETIILLTEDGMRRLTLGAATRATMADVLDRLLAHDPAQIAGALIDAAERAVTAGLILTGLTPSPYVDPSCPERACDRCERLYRGPAVYCSLSCALADAR